MIADQAPTSRILVVDDEPHVRKILHLSLCAEGFDVLEASTAEDAISLVQTAAPDLMILDLGQPTLNGQQVLREAKGHNALAILVLSGRKEDGEKLAALEHGADDYMEKPFAMQDLVHRVKAALDQQAAKRGCAAAGRIVTGNLAIDLDEGEVRREGCAVPLEDAEYALLRLLALHSGRVLTIGRIERALWGKEGDDEHQFLQKQISALRHKLEAEPAFPRYIVTEPAIGFRLEVVPIEKSRN